MGSSFFNEAFYPHCPTPSTPIAAPLLQLPVQSPHSTLNHHDVELDLALDLEINQSLDDAVDFLSSSDVDKLLSSSPRTSTSTPTRRQLASTPPSSVTTQPTSAHPKRKRVGFAPISSISWRTTQQEQAGPHLDKENLLRKLQPSKERTALRSKSILKATRSRANKQDGSNEMHANAVGTWDQVLAFGLRQLTAESPGLRLDAWRSMQQFLVLSPPAAADFQAVQGRYSTLLGNAIRDVEYTGHGQDNGLPYQLPNYALKFLTKFVQLPADLSIDLCATLLEVIERQLQRDQVSKPLLRCCLEFLYHQNFSSDIMTSRHMQQVVEAIHATKLHETSSGTLLDEMKVCRKFVDQSPEGMIAAAPSWLEIFMHGMVSADVNTFSYSVDTLFDISIKLGHRLEISRALQRYLHSTVNEDPDRTTVERLLQDLTAKTDFARGPAIAIMVPKALSALFMLARGKGPAAVFANHFRAVVEVTRPYFRKSSASIVPSVYTAWSYLLIAQLHCGRWPEDIVPLLRRPIEVELMKKTTELNSRRTTADYSRSVYLVSLYCSFAPDARPANMKHKWDYLVKDVLLDMIRSKTKSQTCLATDIFCALLSSAIPWDTDLLQPRTPWHSVMLQVENLPRTDAAWLRNNMASAVLPVMEAVMKSQYKTDHAVKTFRAVVNAVAHAGANEIVITKEAKNAVADLTTFLGSFWPPYSQDAQELIVFGDLLDVLIEQPATSQGKKSVFTEKVLQKSLESDRMEVATTPTHRSNQQPTSAIAHFITLLTQELVEHHPRSELAQSQDEPNVLSNIIRRLTRQLCLCELTLLSKITALCSTTRKLIQIKQASGGSDGRVYVDGLCKESLVLMTDLFVRSDSYGHSPTDALQSIYSQLIVLLTDIACDCTGLGFQLNACYRAVVARAQVELGAGGVLISLAEPAARAVHNHLLRSVATSVVRAPSDDTLACYTDAIVATAPANIPAADIRRALNRDGIARFSAAVKRSDLLEIYHMINLNLQHMYIAAAEQNSGFDALMSHIFAVMRLLGEQDQKTALGHLEVMQSGLSTLLLDRSGLFGEDGLGEHFAYSVRRLWNTILQKGLLASTEQEHIFRFDELIASGLSGRSADIINQSVEAWNRNRGTSEQLAYPPRVAKALRKLQNSGVEILLAGVLPSPDEKVPDSPLLVQDALADIELNYDGPVQPELEPMRTIPRLAGSSIPQPNTSRRRQGSPVSRNRPRPRHEDSQTHFEPIPSSPLPQPNVEVLTARQLEVAERQREGSVALFAGHSTPLPAVRHLDHHHENATELQSTSPATPVLAATQDDAIPSSSPVIASIRRRESSVRRSNVSEFSLSPGRHVHDDNIPSSPPAAPMIQPIRSSRLSAGPSPSSARAQSCERPQVAPVNREVLSCLTDIPVNAAEHEPEELDHDLQMHSSALGETQSFNSIVSVPLTMTQSADSLVRESIILTSDDAAHQPENQNDPDPSQLCHQSNLGESQNKDSQRSKRKRRQSTIFSKRRKTADSHVYNTNEFIRFTAKPRFSTPDDMLLEIVVNEAVEDGNQSDIHASVEIDDELQVPATSDHARSRTRRDSIPHRGASPYLQQSSRVPKRGRSSPVSDNQQSSTKRQRLHNATPRDRQRSISSVHYVDVTPGNAAGKRTLRSTKTDTPDAEEFVSMSQQAQASVEVDQGDVVDETVVFSTYSGNVGSATEQTLVKTGNRAVPSPPAFLPELAYGDSEADAVITSQIDESEPGAQLDSDEEDSGKRGSRSRAHRTSLSLSSRVGSPDSQTSQSSSFSVSAFAGVMSRFMEQIRNFATGGRPQAAVEAARQMEEEANRTVERLDRQVRRIRSRR